MCTMPCAGLGMNATGTGAMLRLTVQVADGRRPMQVSMRGRIFARGRGRRPRRACAGAPCRSRRPCRRRAGRRRCRRRPGPEPRRAARCSRRTTRGTRRSTTLAVRRDSRDADREHQLAGQDEPAPRLRRRRRVRHPVQGRARDAAEGARSTTPRTATRAIPVRSRSRPTRRSKAARRAPATGTCSCCNRERVISTSSGARSGRGITGTPTSA